MKKSHRWGRPLPREQRGYGSAHLRIRRRLIREVKFCQQCLADGKGEVPGTIADHRIPKCQGGSDDESNYQLLCSPCSLSKTGREGVQMRLARKRARKAAENLLP